MRIALSVGTILALVVGCAPEDPARPPDLRPVIIAPAQTRVVPRSVVVSEIELGAIEGTPVGVAVEPSSGRRLVMTQHGALHVLGESAPIWQGGPLNDFGYTDVAALGEDRVAITSLGDGYLLELVPGTMTPHFCYEPGWWEPEGANPVQISHAVAHDPLGGRIYAQPRTVENGGWGNVTESFVAAYDEAGGADLTWWAVDDLGFVATGMTILPRESGEPRLVLGAGVTLHRFDVASGELSALAELSELGVWSIAGLAIDGAAGTLLVLDDARRRVVELDLEALELDR